MATSSYDNIISTLQSTINYNLAEINSLQGSSNSDDIARVQTLTNENKELNDGILQIQSSTSDLNENIATINDLTMYTSDIIKTESDLTSERLAKMKNESTNKMRMVGINNYYANKYNDQSEIMIIIIVTCLSILILWYINTIVQSSIFYVLIAIVVSVGVITIAWKCYYLIMRNSIDYNQSDFDIKSKNLPEIDILRGATGTLMTAGSTGSKDCENEKCCIAPEYYSFKNGKCYASAAAAALSEFSLRV